MNYLDNLVFCRLCTAYIVRDRAVRYSRRHSACFKCFLKRHGEEGLLKLWSWQIEQFPALLLKEFNLWDIAKKKIKRHAKGE